MIRILHVVTDMRRGGLETLIMNYYRVLNREEIQFDFLVHRFYRGDYDNEIESLGGKIYRLPRLNPISIRYKKTLGDFFVSHPEYRIIHVHQDCLSSVICKVAKEHNIPIRIAHSHSSSQDKNLKYLIKLYYMRSIPVYATDLLACSKKAGEWMYRGNRFVVLNNAIDAEKYAYDVEKRHIIRESLNIKSDEFVIGHVGRFSKPKNHGFLIDIFYEIQKIINAKLVLIGDGELKNDIAKKVNQLGIEKKVLFTGIRKDVSDIMQAMDSFVFPSIYEGLPLSLVEAQAAGLPCFISDCVPIECKKTELVSQLSLNDGAKKWADNIISTKGNIRRNTYNEICLSGFDVKENVHWLERYYKSKAILLENVQHD